MHDSGTHDSSTQPGEPFDPRKQGGQFDKIVKENIHGSLPLLLNLLLGLSYDSFTFQVPDIQVTLERKTDVILQVKETPDSDPYILHLEFQSSNSSSMAVRMLFYYAFLRSRYNMPIRQRVIYLGNDAVNMPHELQDGEHLDYHFPIHDVRTLNAKALLAAEVPEEVVFAILADYGELDPEAVLRTLITRLQELVSDPIRLKSYILQTGVLAQLRSLEAVFTETIKDMPVDIDVDRIPFVGEALRKAETRGETLGITKTLEILKRLKAGEQNLEALAREFEVTLEQVRYIQQQS